MMLFLPLLLPILLLILPQLGFGAIVQTTYGAIEGIEEGATNGDNKLHLFKKIPFARPPIGKLRFQRPFPPEKWSGKLDGTAYGPACMSNSTTSKSPQKWVDEDCLHMNIYTSDKCLKSKDCAVGFYVHGGAMNYDSAVMFNDTFIIDTFPNRDVILVIPAFRLGFTSHFTVENQDIAPYNVGMLDIIQALEFTNEVIDSFGGDKKKITVWGHSYGGATVGALVFSDVINKDQRLFQQAISMSASYEFGDTTYQLSVTKQFAKLAGCEPSHRLVSKDAKEKYMLECLQNKDQYELLSVQRTMEENGVKMEAMVLERPLFQGDNYYDFFNKPTVVPYMTGTTIYELDHTTLLKDVALPLKFDNREEVNQKYRDDIKYGRLKFNHSDESQTFIIATKLRTDALVNAGGSVYLYEYSYPKHAKHTDDLAYLMGVHPFEQDENEQKLEEIYKTIFTDFMKYGKPAEDFKTTDISIGSYYDIHWNETSGRRPKMDVGYQQAVFDYWLKEQMEYDRSISEMKKLKKTQISQRMMPIQGYYNDYLTNFILFTVLVFFGGFIFAKCCCMNKRRNVYIQLDGHNYEELDNIIKTY